jgi:hypothetical protein
MWLIFFLFSQLRAANASCKAVNFSRISAVRGGLLSEIILILVGLDSISSIFFLIPVFCGMLLLYSSSSSNLVFYEPEVDWARQQD